jgi:glycosyltransferase involved in cell wall biosynthesis
MRVLYFTRDYTPHDWRFLNALAETEHKVFYLRLEQQGTSLEDRPLPPQIEVIPWQGGRKPFRPKDFPRLSIDLKRVIRYINPDLVHAGPIQTAAFLTALSGFQPLVSMSWGYDLLRDAERNAVWRWVTRYTLARSAVLVGDCETVRARAIAYGMRAERVVTFPWGVDLKHFAPALSEEERLAFRRRWGWGEQAFVLISVRAWEPIYGVEELAHAFVQVSRELPQVCLIMLGNGSLAGRIRRIFLQGGVLDRVQFPGQVSQANLPQYYRSADLFVSASHSDGTSISLLEAMACGCPVLVSDIPGNREWVSHGVQGWLFETGSAEALASAIRRAVEERDRLSQMGRAARHLAEQRADWSQNFPQLLEAYRLAASLVEKH